jgi:hypothetical protein
MSSDFPLSTSTHAIALRYWQGVVFNIDVLFSGEYNVHFFLFQGMHPSALNLSDVFIQPAFFSYGPQNTFRGVSVGNKS